MNAILRFAVFAVVAAGAITGLAASKNMPLPVSHQVLSSNMPMPMCPLDDPNACGFR